DAPALQCKRGAGTDQAAATDDAHDHGSLLRLFEFDRVPPGRTKPMRSRQITLRALAVQHVHHLIGDHLHEQLDVAFTRAWAGPRLSIRGGAGAGVRGRFVRLLVLGWYERLGFGLEVGIALAEKAIAAEVAILQAPRQPGIRNT